MSAGFNSSSFAAWDIHNMFADIVRSDACPIPDLLPSYDLLRFDYSQPKDTVVLYMGEYGNSQILAHPNGSVTKRVIRDSRIRKAGTTMEVNRPMG
ncbi:hypothetical protein G6011_01137 [Alternaria panax]|uniref:Uncharacterized protein n=1 Tax=Alternaria panax TaxID=48097 RepID=A0AAD4IJB4_9PLEO|nr:hypothetical protein G6011_01137 [Alternaria panax]